MGSFYERLVGLTKQALRKTIGKKCLTEKQLSTVLTEVEAIVNSQPSVYMGNDIKSSHVFTPSDFLLINPNNIIPGFSCSNQDADYYEETPERSAANKLLNVWKYGQRNLNYFWSLQRTEYLLSLREQAQTQLKHHRKQASNIPKKGDVVLIKDNLPRGRWKIGSCSKERIKQFEQPRYWLHLANCFRKH